MFAEITHLNTIIEMRKYIIFLLCLCLVLVTACNSKHTNNSTKTENSADATELYKKALKPLASKITNKQ